MKIITTTIIAAVLSCSVALAEMLIATPEGPRLRENLSQEEIKHFERLNEAGRQGRLWAIRYAMNAVNSASGQEDYPVIDAQTAAQHAARKAYPNDVKAWGNFYIAAVNEVSSIGRELKVEMAAEHSSPNEVVEAALRVLQAHWKVNQN